MSGSGSTRSVGIDYLRVTIDVEDDPGTITLDGGCWTIEARDDTLNTCELVDDLPQLEEMFDDPQPVQDLIEAFQAAFDDYENPGFTVKEVDGGWYLSPMTTVADQLLAVLRAVDRDEIEELIAAIETAMESDIELDTGDLVPGEDLLDDYTNPNDDATATTVPSDTVVGDDTTTSVDPEEECFVETEGTAAAECYQGLVDAGTIDAVEVPVYLRVPECGLADLYWSGDYYDLPDAEFVTVVEEAAPCFQDAVTAGTIGANDIPLELEAPECLAGPQLVRRHLRRRLLRRVHRVHQQLSRSFIRGFPAPEGFRRARPGRGPRKHETLGWVRTWRRGRPGRGAVRRRSR